MVRDRLMGRVSKDIDLEVFGVPASELRDLLARFGSVNIVGESFTVYKIGDVDVSLPRRDSKTGRDIAVHRRRRPRDAARRKPHDGATSPSTPLLSIR